MSSSLFEADTNTVVSEPMTIERIVMTTSNSTSE